MAEIERHGHAAGAVVGFDLAHAVGNIVLELHSWNVDFAVWCSYKYLNSGAGSVGGLFLHQRHARNTGLPRFAGWWGHDKSTRFLMGPEFQPMPSAEGWQLSNPPILSLAAVRASLDVFADAGFMSPLRAKSELLTAYLGYLLNTECGDNISILTPTQPEQRGCQLSLTVSGVPRGGRTLHRRLEAAGIACDWREPNVIRVAPTPLYNSFEDVHRFVAVLRDQIISEE
jgi:kynureninase